MGFVAPAKMIVCLFLALLSSSLLVVSQQPQSCQELQEMFDSTSEFDFSEKFRLQHQLNKQACDRQKDYECGLPREQRDTVLGIKSGDSPSDYTQLAVCIYFLLKNFGSFVVSILTQSSSQ